MRRYFRRRTLSDQLSLTNTIVELPNEAVIHEIGLLLTVTVSNSDSSAHSTTIEDIAKNIEIRVEADGGVVNYALKFRDLLIDNYYRFRGKVYNDLGTSVSVGASSTTNVTLFGVLAEAPLHAILRNRVITKMSVDTTIDSNLSISAVTGKLTIYEEVFGTLEDYSNI